jgi:hypothetical protein
VILAHGGVLISPDLNRQVLGAEDVSLDVSLLRDGSLADAQTVTVPAQGQAGVHFELPGIERGTLQAVLDHEDDLALDNQAYATIDPGRRARVLLATPGNLALQLALDTGEVRELADVSVVAPAELDSKPHQALALAAHWDLMIYDRCTPQTMPQANTLFIGRVPPVTGWSQGSKTTRPLIIDTDRVHPLMQYLELGDVLVVEGTPLKTPPGGAALIDAAQWGMGGTLCVFQPGETACLACLYPETPPFEESFPVVGAISSAMGSLAALEAIKILSGVGRPQWGRMLTYDGFRGGVSMIQLTRRSDCACCAGVSSDVQNSIFAETMFP